LVIKVYLNLKKRYGNYFHIFSQYELGDFDYFMRPLPDLYLNRIKLDSNLPNDYLLNIFLDKPTFIIKKLLDSYWKHCETSTWQSDTKGPYPSLLICCPSPRVETTIQAYGERLIDQTGGDELNILTTTTKALLSEKPTVWGRVEDPKQLLSL